MFLFFVLFCRFSIEHSGGDHPFQLGDAPWVIRTHSFIFRESRRYHSCTDYRSDLAISTSVTRVGRTSMDLEHGIYHEPRWKKQGGRGNPLLNAQTDSFKGKPTQWWCEHVSARWLVNKGFIPRPGPGVYSREQHPMSSEVWHLHMPQGPDLTGILYRPK